MRARILTACLVVALGGSAAPSIALAQGTAPAVDPETRDRSRAAFKKGVTQLRAQDWVGARASFEAAWALYPHPSILLNLGIARLKTDDPVRAEQDFVRFLSEDFGASQEELAAAREALAEAKTKIGTLRVAATPATARVSVDGRTIETVRRSDAAGADSIVAEVRLKPGRHAVAVEADGFGPASRDVDVVAKGEASVSLALVALEKKPPPPPEERSPVRTIVGWSMVGLAGAGLVTGIVCAVNAKSLSQDYGDTTSPRYQDPDTKSEGITFRTSADVAFGVAIAAGATAVILLLTDVGRGTSAVGSATQFGSPLLRW